MLNDQIISAIINFLKKFLMNGPNEKPQPLVTATLTPPAPALQSPPTQDPVSTQNPEKPSQPIISAATNQPAPKDVPVPVAPLLFDTQQNAQHSVRVICDNNSLNLYEKDVIYACIMEESQCRNYLPDGKPTIHENFETNKDGTFVLDKEGKKILSSTDWGICQFNDTEGWYIGKRLLFPSVDYLMAHPERAVQVMVDMAITGKLDKWVSYSSGAYLKHMPQNASTLKQGRF